MQREGGDPMRNAFSMLTAIFVIVIMATVGTFILNISGKTLKETVLQYRHEQAILYARSYTELAIMGRTANPNLNSITGGIADYSISLSIIPVASSPFILVDINVTYQDDDLGGSASPVTYFRRTLQKL